MWHRSGGVVVTTVDTASAGLRVDDQDWSRLALHIFPHLDTHPDSPVKPQERFVYEKGTAARTSLLLTTTSSVTTQELVLDISRSDDVTVERGWLLRVQLQHGQRLVKAIVSASEDDSFEQVSTVPVRHIFAHACAEEQD
jgi:hypothetical protein